MLKSVIPTNRSLSFHWRLFRLNFLNSFSTTIIILPVFSVYYENEDITSNGLPTTFLIHFCEFLQHHATIIKSFSDFLIATFPGNTFETICRAFSVLIYIRDNVFVH